MQNLVQATSIYAALLSRHDGHTLNLFTRSRHTVFGILLQGHVLLREMRKVSKITFKIEKKKLSIFLELLHTSKIIYK